MQLSLQTFSGLVQGMAASVQASAAQLLDLTVGSTLRAILESSASVGLWMQWLILLVLQMTRAATSSGADLDSWMADFSLTRLPATAASGVVTFSRFSAVASALIPVGALVRTIDGSQTFSVVMDTTAPGWTQQLGGYSLGVGMASLDVPVVSTTLGTCGNVLANTITVLATALSGVDSVTNQTAFINGIDQESDAAFRSRFQGYLASRSQATLAAVEYAINSVQQGLNYSILENENPLGETQLGNFVVFVDDGSGYPSSSLLSTVQQAIDAIRPVGSTFGVFAPAVVQVAISLVVAPASNNVSATLPQIVQAVQNYVNSLPIGVSLALSRIIQVAYDSGPGIINVTDVLLNDEPADVIIQPSQVVKSATVLVS